MTFWLNKIDKKLDRVGGGGDTTWYEKISWTQVMQFMHFDIMQNDTFVIGASIMRQKRGIAIGGTTSAPAACAYCCAREHLFLRQVQPWSRVPHLNLHPCHLPARPARFRDNIVGIKYVDQPLKVIQASLENVYDLKLQVEGEGDRWTSLEGDLSVQTDDQGRQRIGIRLADKGGKFPPGASFLIRFPDNATGKARRTLKSMVPSAAKKIIYYRESMADVVHNITLTTNNFIMKGYPTTWWKKPLWFALGKWGFPRTSLD